MGPSLCRPFWALHLLFTLSGFRGVLGLGFRGLGALRLQHHSQGNALPRIGTLDLGRGEDGVVNSRPPWGSRLYGSGFRV